MKLIFFRESLSNKTKGTTVGRERSDRWGWWRGTARKCGYRNRRATWWPVATKFGENTTARQIVETEYLTGLWPSLGLNLCGQFAAGHFSQVRTSSAVSWRYK